MVTGVCSYQAPVFRASNSPAARTVSRSRTDSLTTVGAVVGGAFDVIGADVPSLAQAARARWAGVVVTGLPITERGAATPG